MSACKKDKGDDVLDGYEDLNAWDSLNVNNVEKNIDCNGNLLQLTNDQKKHIKQAEQDFAAGKQVLCLIHGGVGVGKYFLTNAVKEAIKSNSKFAVLACPTGSAAAMLDGGQTFHSVFYVKDETKLICK